MSPPPPPWEDLSEQEQSVLRRMGLFVMTPDELATMGIAHAEKTLRALVAKGWVLRAHDRRSYLRLGPVPPADRG